MGLAIPADVRREFRALRDGVYLDVAARAPMADRVSDEIVRYLERCRQEGAPKGEWLKRVEDIRLRFGRLIGASADEVAFVKNTSDGINTIAQGLELAAGDNVVIAPELEHGNNVYPWLHLRRRGVEVRTLPVGVDGLDLRHVEEQIDDRTRVVSVSSVSFVSGARLDLARLAKLVHAEQRDVFLLVDAAQGLGSVSMDVRSLEVDGIAAPTQKGLLGMYGSGVLYCRSTWLNRITPPFLSRVGVDLGIAPESELGALDEYELTPTARRFEVGNPNFAGLFALDAALSLLEEVGLDSVEHHVGRLSARLIEGLQTIGLRVVTPEDPDKRAGIVSIAHHDAELLSRRLLMEGFRISVRRGFIRASLHVFNNERDINAFIDALDHPRVSGGTK